MSEMGTKVVLGPLKSSTHLWQLIDRGPDALLKRMIMEHQTMWMSEEGNEQKWPSLKALERRTLVTCWVQHAWEEYCLSQCEGRRMAAQTAGLFSPLNSEDKWAKC